MTFDNYIHLRSVINRVRHISDALGWHDRARTKGEWMANILAEIGEATEQARLRRPPIYQEVDSDDGFAYALPGPGWNPRIKPEGEAIELADACIWIFDWIAEQPEFSLEHLVSIANSLFDPDMISPALSAAEIHVSLYRQICRVPRAYTRYMTRGHLLCAVWLIEAYFDFKSWDLIEAINIKCDYNETRTYRHGNKAF